MAISIYAEYREFGYSRAYYDEYEDVIKHCKSIETGF